MAFPPKPLYPNGIDTDKTLFLVYNTSEARLAADNNAWSQEVEIVPVKSDQLEIWADNGFANLDGELFYYDSVEKNSDGKVYKLKKCGRNLGGTKTKFTRQGAWVRGFVVAEHRNQLVDTILKIENFVGFNFDPRQETLDWRIRNLANIPVISDDWNCPEINFTFNVIERNTQTGILARYLIQISSTGSLGTSNFRLDFGDGTFTTSSLEGEHRYSIDAIIDPILTITNDNCQIISSPIDRANPLVLPDFTEVPFEVPVPPTTILPPIVVPSITCPDPEFQIPPLISPCGTVSTFPSIIGPGINLPSTVTIIGPDPPVNIPSVVSIVGGFSLPDVIIFDNIPPSVISIVGSIPSTIVIEIPSSSILLNLDLTDLPALQVDWGTPPAMQFSFATQGLKSQPIKNEFGEEFGDIFTAQSTVEYQPMGLPTEIKILPPEEPMEVKLNTADLKDIFLKNFDIPDQIFLTKDKSLEEGIKLLVLDKIKLDTSETVKLELINPLPNSIYLDTSGLPSSIKVEGMIDTIKVEGIPDFLKVQFPEKMPEIDLVYRGGPIEMKLVMDNMITTNEDGTTNCVMLVPCNK
jgi:hypothetical protein